VFRIPGDEVELNLAKIRLQHANRNNSKNNRIILSERNDYILVGDLENLLKPPAESIMSSQSQPQPQPSLNSTLTHGQGMEKDGGAGEDVPMSIVLISNVETVCQILKMSIRDLPDPLVSVVVFKQLVDLIKSFEKVLCEAVLALLLPLTLYLHFSSSSFFLTFFQSSSLLIPSSFFLSLLLLSLSLSLYLSLLFFLQTVGLNELWERETSTVLATLPYENLSTLVYMVK
jgi:hypothetical protein